MNITSTKVNMKNIKTIITTIISYLSIVAATATTKTNNTGDFLLKISTAHTKETPLFSLENPPTLTKKTEEKVEISTFKIFTNEGLRLYLFQGHDDFPNWIPHTGIDHLRYNQEVEDKSKFNLSHL